MNSELTARLEEVAQEGERARCASLEANARVDALEGRLSEALSNGGGGAAGRAMSEAQTERMTAEGLRREVEILQKALRDTARRLNAALRSNAQLALRADQLRERARAGEDALREMGTKLSRAAFDLEAALAAKTAERERAAGEKDEAVQRATEHGRRERDALVKSALSSFGLLRSHLTLTLAAVQLQPRQPEEAHHLEAQLDTGLRLQDKWRDQWGWYAGDGEAIALDAGRTVVTLLPPVYRQRCQLPSADAMSSRPTVARVASTPVLHGRGSRSAMGTPASQRGLRTASMPGTPQPHAIFPRYARGHTRG